MGQLAGGVSELADFMMLKVLNRAQPMLRQHAHAPSIHPFDFFIACLQLAGELSTLAWAERCPPEFPLYRHDDLRGSFAPLLEALRRMMSVVLEQNAQAIELVERSHGVRTAVVRDLQLVRTAVFVLAVNAQVPADPLRQRFVAQTKIGPPDRIRDLVNHALPGIALRPLPVAPRQLPYHAGFHYFELERDSELWRLVESTGNLAIHTAGVFPGLELELWAIRS